MAALTIAQLEQAIVDRLVDEFPSVEVSGLPTDPEILGQPVGENQIWVALDNDSLTPPEGGLVGRKQFRQSQTINFVLVLRLFDLYSGRPAYGLIDQIRQCLTGLGATQAPSAVGLYSTGVRFSQFGEGLWLYQMSLEYSSNLLITNRNQGV
jgi:hypothetical protein